MAVAFFGAASVSAGLIALTTLPKFLSASLCFLVAALALLADYLVFRPNSIGDPALRRKAILANAAIAALSSLSTAYAVGLLVGSSNGPTFTYIIAPTASPGAHTYAGPSSAAYPYVRTHIAGDQVEVVCYVKEGQGRWYQLSEGDWVAGNDILPAAHTGQRRPSDCPP